ncbi:MAG: glutamine-hydrolyzing carbamoyl-phosphate synthase small subunit [Flavobacteriales bacterium]|nr:glutamine-hydrolyzing carbamoyl-phosphate synthase small subunit [Flavobacteriales bacterium]
MNKLPEQPAILLLEDGTVFHGLAAGKVGTATGEIAFNTGMTGYQEIFTDPSYYGQIVVMATAHIGNYGTHTEEIESDSMKIAGLVTKKFSANFSREGGEMSLQNYLERDEKVGIRDVDTRALIRHIRNKGAMNAIVSSEETNINKLKTLLAEVPSMVGLELSSRVTCSEPFEMGDPEGHCKVAVLDLGVKKNILRCLCDVGCKLRVFPMNSSREEMEAWSPDAYMISNGPGDPSAMPNTIQLVKEIIDLDKPVFGICLGHQVIALSQGAKTEKMFNGHRGINHPIKNLSTGKSEITSQNHGFVVNRDSIEEQSDMYITHVHLNDNTIAGLALKSKPVFSVQYHPEASAGPHDSRYLFLDFIKNIKESKQNLTI